MSRERFFLSLLCSLFLVVIFFATVIRYNKQSTSLLDVDQPHLLRKLPNGHGMMNHSDSRSVLIFRHMSKTGGTFLRLSLPEIIPGKPAPYPPQSKLSWQKEAYRVNDRLIFISDRVAWRDDLRASENKPKSFVLLTMRHPCSWYRSYYHYRPKEPLKDSRLNSSFAKQSLNEWVKTITFDNTLGYMSYRFWKAYVAPMNCYFYPYGDGPPERMRKRDKDHPCSMERAKKDLESLDPRRLADCWMLTDTLFSDLGNCLRNWDGLSVDWERFDWVRSVNAPPEIFGGEKKDPRREETNECENEYSQSVQELIQEVDKELFRLFQIPSCCANPSDSLDFPFGEANEIVITNDNNNNSTNNNTF